MTILYLEETFIENTLLSFCLLVFCVIIFQKLGKKSQTNIHQQIAHFSLTLAIYNLKTSLFYVNVIVFIFLQDFSQYVVLCEGEKQSEEEIVHSIKNNSYLLPIFDGGGVRE